MFDTLHPIELNLIRSLQAIRNPILDSIMLVLNLVDTMPFYIFVILCVWFFYNQKQGIRFFFLYLLSAFVNQSLKILFAEPRPCTLEPALGLLKTNSFGFPSGAAQSMIVLFGFLSITFKKQWVWYGSIFSVLLISFSRIYLGLHFFSDIIGGWIAGATILAIYLLSLPFIERFITKCSRVKLQIFSIIIYLVFWSITLNLYTKVTVITALGLSTGLIWKPFLPETHSFLSKALRMVIAIAGIGLLFVLATFLPTSYLIASLISDFLAALWLGFGVPYLCKKTIL